MTPEIEFENSCGNVFADLGLDHAEDLYMRAALGAQVVAMLKAQGYTPAEAAAWPSDWPGRRSRKPAPSTRAGSSPAPRYGS